MSKVIVEIGDAQQFGGASTFSATGGAVAVITSSGTSQATTITGAKGKIAHITNYGDDPIWVNFGADAAVGVGRFIAPNTFRDLGPLSAADTVSVINDS